MPAMTMVPMATTVAGDEPDKRCKQHAGEDAGNGKAALEMADAGDGKTDDSLGDAAGRHEGRGEDEEGDGKQRVVAGEGVEQRLRDRAERAVGMDHQEDDRRQAKGDRNGHADQEKADDHQEKKCDIHGSVLLVRFGCGFLDQVLGLVAGDDPIGLALEHLQVLPGRNGMVMSVMPSGRAK